MIDLAIKRMKRVWNEEKDNLLRRHYPKRDLDWVAGRIGVSKAALKSRALEADNLWTDSLALDLDELAQQKTFIDRLTEQMQAPGYQV